MAVDMDISGWSVAGGINYEFADDSVIDGRAFLVVSSSPAALLSQTGFSGALGPFTDRLSKGGEEQFLSLRACRLGVRLLSCLVLCHSLILGLSHQLPRCTSVLSQNRLSGRPAGNLPVGRGIF